MLFGRSQSSKGCNSRLCQTLTDRHRGNDYEKRNLGDLSIQSAPVQDDNTAKQHETGRLF